MNEILIVDDHESIGAFAFVKKPFDLSEIRSVIERALKRYLTQAARDQSQDDA